MPDLLDEKAELWAKFCLENIEDFADESNIDKWTELQAHFFWLYKGKPEQDENAQRTDYLGAQTYLAYFISDAAVNCHKCQECILQRYSHRHYSLMQSITLEKYLEVKSYLRWLARTKKSIPSEHSDGLHDYLTVSSLFREAISKCNWCGFAPQSSFWTQTCSTHTLDHSIVLRIENIQPVEEYARYIASFYRGLHSLLSGETIPWVTVKTTLYFMFRFPFAVSMFEVVLARAMLGDFFGRLYGQLVSEGHAGDELIEPQAWYFWFLRGCPDQDVSAQRNDYYDAKRYLAYVLTKHLFTKGHQQQTSPLMFMSSNDITFIQSLSLHEYISHDVVARQLADKRQAFSTLETTTQQHDGTLAEFTKQFQAWSRKDHHVIRGLVDSKIRPALAAPEAIRKAKLFALERQNKRSASLEASVDEHMRKFYSNYALPTELSRCQLYVNMLEVAIGSSVTRQF